MAGTSAGAGATALVVAAVGALAILAGAGAALQNTPVEDQTIVNESHVATTAGESDVDVRTAERYYDNETVYNSSGTELVEAENPQVNTSADYDFDTENGTIVWSTSTERLSDNETATITYSFRATPSETRRVRPLVAAILVVTKYLPYLAGAFGVVGVVAGSLAVLRGVSI